MGVGSAIDVQTGPAVHLDRDVGNGDVGVLFEEVRAEDAGVQLGRVDRVLLGGNVDGVLDGVGGDDDAVVGNSVSGELVGVQCSLLV
jgi:hypothetical protein